MRRITVITYAALAIAALGSWLYKEKVDIDKGEKYYVRQCLKQTLTSSSGSHRYLQLDLAGRRRINIPISRETSNEELEELRASFDGGIVEPINKPFSTAKWGRHATYPLDNLYLVESSRTYGALSARMKALQGRIEGLESEGTRTDGRLNSLRDELSALQKETSNYKTDTNKRLEKFEAMLRKTEEEARPPGSIRSGGKTWLHTGTNKHGQAVYRKN